MAPDELTRGSKIEITTIVYDEASEPIQKITKRIDDLGNKTRRFTQTFEKFGPAAIGVNKSIKNLDNDFINFYNTGRILPGGMDRINSSFEAFMGQGKRVIKTTETISKGIQQFNFGWLSTMFFGMQLQRTFGGIYQSGTKAFTGIMDSTEGATTALGTFNAGMEYLKFTVGDAINTTLEPLLPLILDMINGFANFIQQHPRLITAIVLTGIALGTLSVAISELKLLFQGLSMIIGTGGAGNIIGSLTSLNPILLAIAAAAIVVGAFVITEWSKIQDASTALGKAIKAELGGNVTEADKQVGIAVRSMEYAFNDFAIKISGSIAVAMAMMAAFNKMLARWAISGYLDFINKLFGIGASKEQISEMSKLGGLLDITQDIQNAINVQKDVEKTITSYQKQYERLQKADVFAENPQSVNPPFGQLATNPYHVSLPTSQWKPNTDTSSNITSSQTNNYYITATAPNEQALADKIQQRIKELNYQTNITMTAMTNAYRGIP